MNKVFVFADKIELLADLCAGGKQYGKQVVTVVFGDESDAKKALSFGADKVYHVDENKERLEDYFETVQDLVRKEQPELVLIKATVRGKLMAGRLAAAFGTSALTDVTRMDKAADQMQTERVVYGGAAVKTEQSKTALAIVTMGNGLFTPLENVDCSQGLIIKTETIAPQHIVRCIEKRAKTTESVDLSAAKRVIGVGRGFKAEADIAMAEALGKVLGAEIGCTRPIADGEKWLPKERYIGVSGLMLKPDLYIAIGTSGQVQHMIGVNQAKTIVAINKDKSAPVFKQADYGIVGDLYTVIPELISQLKSE